MVASLPGAQSRSDSFLTLHVSEEKKMYRDNSYRKHPSICNLVPAFAFYSRVGDGLAEGLVHLFEGIWALLNSFRR